jgi:U1 small nuclear ribonucleoprotein
MSGNGSGPAIAHLPPNFRIMFDPRAPIEFKPPIVKRTMPPLLGISQFTDQFETTEVPERIIFETPRQRQERKRNTKMAAETEKMKTELEAWDPHKGTNCTEDAYKTLFVARTSFDTTEAKLKRWVLKHGEPLIPFAYSLFAPPFLQRI